jgi:hypothetical protein
MLLRALWKRLNAFSEAWISDSEVMENIDPFIQLIFFSLIIKHLFIKTLVQIRIQ